MPGFDHGVFVPFRLMFGEDFTDIPIIEASLDGSLDPLKNWAVGQAVSKLRSEFLPFTECHFNSWRDYTERSKY